MMVTPSLQSLACSVLCLALPSLTAPATRTVRMGTRLERARMAAMTRVQAGYSFLCPAAVCRSQAV